MELHRRGARKGPSDTHDTLPGAFCGSRALDEAASVTTWWAHRVSRFGLTFTPWHRPDVGRRRWNIAGGHVRQVDRRGGTVKGSRRGARSARAKPVPEDNP